MQLPTHAYEALTPEEVHGRNIRFLHSHVRITVPASSFSELNMHFTAERAFGLAASLFDVIPSVVLTIAACYLVELLWFSSQLMAFAV